MLMRCSGGEKVFLKGSQSEGEGSWTFFFLGGERGEEGGGRERVGGGLIVIRVILGRSYKIFGVKVDHGPNSSYEPPPMVRCMWIL